MNRLLSPRFTLRMAGSLMAFVWLPLAAPGQDSAPERLEPITYSALPLAPQPEDLAQPADILTGEGLAYRSADSLGALLDGLPGVQASAFAPGASRPVIRGLGGQRVATLVNGLDTADVAGLSDDHAVTVVPALAEHVEILRGPAVLLFGSQAAAGAVNVRDARMPLNGFGESGYRGGFSLDGGTVANRVATSGWLGADLGNWSVQATGFRSEAGDIAIPGEPERFHEEEQEHEAEEHGDEEHEEAFAGFLENSFVDTTAGSLGLAWRGETLTVGLAWDRFESDYGVPGHEHAHEPGEEEHGHKEEEEGAEEEGVSIALERDRWEAFAQWRTDAGWLSTVEARFAYTDYLHTEFEGEETGTVFDTNTAELRLEAVLIPGDDWSGTSGIHYSDTDFSALGDEAYVPGNTRSQLAVFTFQEWRRGTVHWQAGARLEHQEITPDAGLASVDKTGLSLAAGAVWHLSDQNRFSIQLGRTERMPGAAELFAEGPHIATSTFEIGDAGLGKETSVHADLTWSRQTGPVTGFVSVFYQDFGNFLALSPLGFEEDGLPAFRHRATEARLYGVEAEAVVHLHRSLEHTWDVILSGDWVRGDDTLQDEPLPRMAPARLGAAVRYQGDRIEARLGARHTFEQDRTAPEETATPGYWMVDSRVTFRLGGSADRGTVLFLAADNLFNEEARAHTSFLKDDTLLPGRNIRAGLEVSF
ncbi:MAG: TonB-dependent receptor [Opitutales bacterium]